MTESLCKVGKSDRSLLQTVNAGLTEFHSAQRSGGIDSNMRYGEAQECDSKFVEQPNYNLRPHLFNLLVEITVLIPHNLIAKSLSVMDLAK
jgi:hypothetical protein